MYKLWEYITIHFTPVQRQKHKKKLLTNPYYSNIILWLNTYQFDVTLREQFTIFLVTASFFLILKMAYRQRTISYLFINYMIFSMFFEVGPALNDSVKDYCPNAKTSLSSVRKRRHLAFPEKSTVSVSTFFQNLLYCKSRYVF